MKPRFEYRQMPYRPAREPSLTATHPHRLILRFIRRYVWPHRAPVLVCITLVSLNACSVYLQAYYTRIVVDDILVVAPPPADPAPVSPAVVVRETLPPRAQTGLGSDAALSRTDGRPPWPHRRLWRIFGFYFATLVSLNLAHRVVQRIQFALAQRITSHLRNDIHDKILKLPTAYHQAHTPGRLMARILSDVNVVQSQMMQILITASAQIVMFLTGIVILLVLDARIALIVILAMIPYVLLMKRVRGPMRTVNREVRHTNACLWSLVSQKIDGMRAILAYGRQRMEYLHLHRLSACLLRDSLAQQRLGAGMTRGAEIVSSLTSRGIFLYCAVLVLDGSMSLGKMMFVFGAVTNLFMPVLQLTQLALQVSFLGVVLQRLTQVFETPPQLTEDPSAVPFPCPLEDGIRLDRVSFAYGEGAPVVLEDLRLRIPAGKWICIMGASGCGKTTLLHLIARLYDPTEGEITFDGTPLNAIRFTSLRRHMAMVPQEAQILSGTVRDNITYGRTDATPRQIIAAARAADCHEFIMQLPVKYETTIGEKGASLSGGQRQRISIARALLTNPEVLLLDDCTSALDANTEQKIQETLAVLLQDKTAVVVSQRVSMAMRCHTIVILENGRILERGSHEALLAAGGYYARLHAQQTG